ncbi:MAG: AmmeMemoRadiSam system protein B [Candidatus Omnitrophica bacterium]|nr:AmmeMemoRadiSam system protein B [Candidatus Omnitrophota bacterium]
MLFGPNHTGYGSNYSIMSQGIWQTPLGQTRINSLLAKDILTGCKLLEEDAIAHTYEHSLEVELPFLQYFNPDFEIVPIVFMSDDITHLKEIGRQVAYTLKNIRDSCLIIASSDMTHYENQQEAEFKDKEALKAILELDEDALIKKIRSLNISMCGWAPVVAMLTAAKLLGAKKASLVRYDTSATVTHDTENVVGYAGVMVY